MRRFVLLVVVIAQLGWGDTAQSQEKRRPPPKPTNTQARLEFYESAMDGKRRPYGICATDDSSVRKPLLVNLQPGLSEKIDNAGQSFRQIEQVIDIARQQGAGCIAMRPTGRGPGSLFQNYGEVDALEAIDDACRRLAVDRDRIVLFGHSMGGAAVFYMTSHYPDRFAGGIPMSGYCDYRLWRKPGGYTFQTPAWEEPSWQARSAALIFENLQHTPLWIMHGAWDRGVGSGVSVEHSRQMRDRLEKSGFAVRYAEVAGAGHHFLDDALFESAVQWMLQQKKQRAPRQVRFATGSLRHNTSYWVAIEQMQQSGELARVEAERGEDTAIAIRTENVRALTLGPLADAPRVDVRFSEQSVADVDLIRAQTFRLEETGRWERTEPIAASEKHHGRSGPIGDLFYENVILVSGTSGSDEENYFTRLSAFNLRNQFQKTNGGLHRGGILGESSVDLPYALDNELSDEAIHNNNLLLFGTPATNRLLERYAERLPLQFGENSIRLGEATFRGEQAAVFAIFPHPENAARYIAVHGGVTPDATTWGSHLNVLLLPDYVAYNGPETLAWGFFGNTWRPTSLKR